MIGQLKIVELREQVRARRDERSSITGIPPHRAAGRGRPAFSAGKRNRARPPVVARDFWCSDGPTGSARLARNVVDEGQRATRLVPEPIDSPNASSRPS
jgi:hypothetical protein